MVKLFFKLNSENSILPKKAGENEVGYDLTAIKQDKKIGDNTYMFDTGVSVQVSDGYYTEIIPRSSLVKTGYILTNSIGIIDPTYRGSLKICLTKIDPTKEDISLPFVKTQLIVRKMIQSEGIEVESLEETERGDGGFGSTDNIDTIEGFADGAFRGGSKEAGCGFVLLNTKTNKTLVECSKHIKGEVTSNIVEYIGATCAVKEVLKYNPKKFILKLDSALVVNQVKGDWEVKKEHLIPLCKELRKLLNRINEWEVKWIPREENTRADFLANEGIDKGNI